LFPLWVNVGSCTYYASYPPALQPAQWPRFEDANGISDGTPVIPIVDINDGFTLNLFLINGMGDFVKTSNLYRFITRLLDDISHQKLSKISFDLIFHNLVLALA
jgi:hypothetical protein